ncbi:MAG: hypothetical protein IJS50_06280 [Desulfovibrio sp.]|nr:hypothetical protein [Desulfovibrio sp.]
MRKQELSAHFLTSKRATFFLLFFFSCLSCIPYTAFEDGREYIFFEEDAESALHYISTIPGDEGIVKAPCIIGGSLLIQHFAPMLAIVPHSISPKTLDHPPKKRPPSIHSLKDT